MKYVGPSPAWVGNNKKIYPLKNIIYNKKNALNRSVQPNQLTRSNCSFHILPHIARGFRTYARFSEKTLGECVEDALIEYMRNHPSDQVSLNLTMSMDSVIMDISSRLQLKLLKTDLKNKIENVERLKAEYKLHKNQNTDLKQRIKSAKLTKAQTELQNNLKALNKLIKKAIPYATYPDIKDLLEKAEEFI